MPPSFLHEALVQLLRSHPLLAVELLRAATPSALPAFDTVVSDSADLGSELAPEAAADCVLRFEAGGRTVFVVVVEVQLSVDADRGGRGGRPVSRAGGGVGAGARLRRGLEAQRGNRDGGGDGELRVQRSRGAHVL
ncbi:MAG: hypothetical protein KA712_12150 [Myxococcales bacterium]|nr:hypothetical protein [Myxococcales bacterium]